MYKLVNSIMLTNHQTTNSENMNPRFSGFFWTIQIFLMKNTKKNNKQTISMKLFPSRQTNCENSDLVVWPGRWTRYFSLLSKHSLIREIMSWTWWNFLPNWWPSRCGKSSINVTNKFINISFEFLVLLKVQIF